MITDNGEMTFRLCIHSFVIINYYQKFAQEKRASMHVPRKPEEQTEVDWEGQKIPINDTASGEIIPCSVFVAALSYSQYAYVEAFLSQTQKKTGSRLSIFLKLGKAMLVPVPAVPFELAK